MSILLIPSKSRSSIPSLTIEKYRNSLQNLSKTPTKLFCDREDEPIDHGGSSELNLRHPLLRAVDSCNGLREFDQVNAQLIVSGLFQHSLTASRVVKKLSSDSQTLSRAVYVFDCIKRPDAFLCNVVMRSFVKFNDCSFALRFYYHCVVGKRVVPNHFTFPILVKACVGIGSVSEGQKAHLKAEKSGFGSDLFVRNSLIHMYSVFGKVDDARKVFDQSRMRDLVSWNSMIHGYAKTGDLRGARELFEALPEKDAFTWNSLISGYIEIGFMEAAKLLFDVMPKKDVVSWNCMIDGYARKMNIIEAVEFFDRMPVRNVVSWNIMLALFVKIKDYNACLVLFDKMLELGDVKPNQATLVSVLTACANFGRLGTGRWVHAYIESSRINPDVLLSTALMTMYSKCGEMDMAWNVFEKMPDKSVVSWNSMIMGYGMNGNGERALEIFLEMEKQGLVPNDATFTCVLSACVHSGMVMEGWWYFDLMKRVHRIEPKVEHYGCMVDLLSRAGLLKDSEELIRKMPMDAGPAIWGSLLLGCRVNSNSELGVIVAKRLIELEPRNIGPYIMLSNIYASKQKWDNVEKVRRMLKENSLSKEQGKSTVHSGECQHGFPVNPGSHHRKSIVLSMLGEMGTRIKLCH